MIILIFVISIFLSISLNIALFILIRNQLFKIRTYEGWIVEFKSDLIETLKIMKDIDKSGTFSSRINDQGIFESDDQVGQIFKELLDLIEKLNQRTQ